MKTTKEEMTEEEIGFIKIIQNEQPTNIACMLNELFNGHYCTALMYRIKLRMEKEMFGENRDGINTFIEFGNESKEKGGSFKYATTDGLVFSSGAFQTCDMVSISKAYNDYVIHYGTHGTNVFGFSLIPTVVVDCLGKNAP